MINEAPMTPGARRAKAAQTKQVYTTAKGGQTLQNLRLRQKGSQDAAARAKKTMSTAARPVAIDTGPVRTPVVPLSAPRILSRKPKPMKPVKPKKQRAKDREREQQGKGMKREKKEPDDNQYK